MRLKKSWAKVLSSALALTLAFSTLGSVPVTAYAQENDKAQENDVTNEESSGQDIIINRSMEGMFTNIGDIGMTIEGDNVILEKASGDQKDHFAIYNGFNDKMTAFTWEADVQLNDGPSAALIIADNNNAPTSGKWYGANINTNDNDGKGQFRIFGVGEGNTFDENSEACWDGLIASDTLHLKLDVNTDGGYTYTFGNANKELKSLKGTIPNWNGGYVGLLTFETKATFSNIVFKNNRITPGEQYKTNLDNLTVMSNGTWEVQSDGLHSNATDKGDSFLYSTTTGTDFVYSTDVKFNQAKGAAALIFRRTGNSSEPNNCYVVNLNAESKKCRLWRWEKGEVRDLIVEKEIKASANNTYTLKVVAVGSWISYYVNDELIANTGDYTLQWNDQIGGQNTVIKEGCFGLLNWDGDMVFQNTYYQNINDESSPLLNDISISPSSGGSEGIEDKTQFVPTEPITIQYVSENVDTIDINVAKKSNNSTVTIEDESGKSYDGGKNIPLNIGANYIIVKNSVTISGMEASLTYRVNVHRRQKNEIYYNELYRDQYHYSVKDGWANDPNGLVYYNGTYHMFYQFYDDIKWGPMHWAHATSTDLIHWEEKPVALYPDANGAMYSGCIVVDAKNESGLFGDGSEGGLVALITAHGNGQRIKLAYSKDEGTTWTKVDEIAADWTDDKLQNKDFRDPKVFRWENKWFMVVAGGPLRIYSSENLKEWQCESTYADLHTECPDLYPIQADDGQIKWVLSRGGRYYKVGDFKAGDDGKWKFIPDTDYDSNDTSKDGVMNFGRDSYAAMTYYVQDFGTEANPNLPEIIELNWMNTWDDYCNLVSEKSGMKFNGTFNLNLKLGLKKENNKYVLTQTPINKDGECAEHAHSGYEELRNTDADAAVELNNVDVGENSELLKDFKGDCYEIIAKFRPEEGTKKIGFKVRANDTESTDIVYDLEQETLYIDRSKSGIIISNKFAERNSQKVTKNSDGSIDLHIYVDMASVEVFAKGYTVAGANQIFPSVSSLGADVFAEGSPAKADITIYPINSIWKDKVTVTTPIEIGSSSSTESKINIGKGLDLNAYLLPVAVEQDITWSVDNDTIVSIKQDETDNTICHITGLKKGVATITATATKNESLTKTFKVSVFENNFDTNIEEFIANGNWFIDDKILSVSNTAANDSYMSVTAVPYKEYTLETELKFEKGLINIFFASKSADPNGAYSVQLNDSEDIRLFYMGGDDIKKAGIGKKLNDGQFHTVKIEKTKDSVTVYVDGTEYLKHTFDSVEDYYNNAYVGLGLWDGALEVKSFNVTSEEQIPSTKPSSEPSNSSKPDNSSEPSNSSKPDNSSEPSNSSEPDNSSKPSNSSEPDNSSEPSNSSEPDNSSEPSNSSEPDNSSEPSNSSEPDSSANPTTAPEKKYAVTFDTSAVKNASVSIQKENGEPFTTGDNVSAYDNIQLIITPDANYVFSEVPVVTSDNISVGTAVSKNGKYIFTIHSARKAANVTVSCTAVQKQFTVTLPDEVKNSVTNATAELDFDSAIANSTVKLIITPDESYAITSAEASINGNTCQVSNAEKSANGVYIITLSNFTANTTIDSLIVKTEEVEVREGGTAIETNVGGANLGETEFKNIQDDIKENLKTIFNNIIKTEPTNEITEEDIEKAKKAVKAIESGSAFIEIELKVDKKFSGMTENEKKESDAILEDIKRGAQTDNSGKNVEVKTATTLDISLFSICKDKENNKEIAKTQLNEITKPVRISMKLPDNIPGVEQGAVRTYYIICLHRDEKGQIKPTKIPCYYNNAKNTISFDGKNFSTYVLCYVDVTPKSGNNSGTTVTNRPSISGGGTAVVLGTVTSTSTPTPTATPSTKPGIIASAAPLVTSTPVPVASSKPSVTNAPSVTDSPMATNSPDDDTDTSSSKVVKGTKVTVKDIIYKVTSVSGTRTVKCMGAKKSIKKVVIPATIKIKGKTYKVTAIAKNAFKGNKKLVKATIGKNVNSIGKKAFKGCNNLKNIVIKTKKLTIKKVGSNAFKGINNKAAVQVPKGKVKAYKKILRAKGAGKNIKVIK